LNEGSAAVDGVTVLSSLTKIIAGDVAATFGVRVASINSAFDTVIAQRWPLIRRKTAIFLAVILVFDGGANVSIISQHVTHVVAGT
jgi:hypothetical protein